MLYHTLFRRRHQSTQLHLSSCQSPSSTWNATPLQYLILISFYIFSVVASSKTSGCGQDLPENQTPGGKSVEVPIQQSSGLHRTYLVHIPLNYDQDTATPLIFSFHGRNHTSLYQETLCGFSRPDWNPDAIVVYPQGINRSWEGDPMSTNVDDVGFVADMISSLSEIYCLDSDRIYAAGKSNGGGFVNMLACDPILSTQIAAFAPVSPALYLPNIKVSDCVGNIPNTINIPCSPGRANIPILDFFGLLDDIIPYNGGPRREGCVISILHWLQTWANMEGYGSEFIETSLYDGNIHKYEFAPNTPNQGIITHYSIKNWYHKWPSTTPTADTPNTTFIDASPLILDFFNFHTLKS